MTVYIIAKLVISDRDTYRKYADGFMEVFNRYPGKLLAVDEDPQVLEGDWPVTRTVLAQFPTKEDVTAWFSSPAYQDIAQHRLASSTASIVVLQGLPDTAG